MPTHITVVVTEEEYAEISALADGRPLSRWIKRMILGNAQSGKSSDAASNHNQDSVRTPDLRMAKRRTRSGRGRPGGGRHRNEH